MTSTAGAGLIDVHQHVFWTDQLARERASAQALHVTPQNHILAWTPQRALEELDANGIARAIGSMSTPGVWRGDAAEAGAHAAAWNDYAAGMVAAHPTRFGFFATIPLPATELALPEIARADGLGADGVGLFTNYDGRYLGDEAFAPVLRDLERRGAVVFVHPTAPAYAAPLPDLLPQFMEFAFETARAIVSLLLAGCSVRYPNIRWIFSHSGGALPILADRLDRLFDKPAYREKLPHGFKEALSQFYFDSTGMSSPANADLVRAIAPPSHLLFGSDALFVAAGKGVAAMKALGFAAAPPPRSGDRASS